MPSYIHVCVHLCEKMYLTYPPSETPCHSTHPYRMIRVCADSHVSNAVHWDSDDSTQTARMHRLALRENVAGDIPHKVHFLMLPLVCVKIRAQLFKTKDVVS